MCELGDPALLELIFDTDVAKSLAQLVDSTNWVIRDDAKQVLETICENCKVISREGLLCLD